MKNSEKNNRLDTLELRRRAEQITKEKSNKLIQSYEKMSVEQTRELLHELSIHQIELELQNDELHRSQEELEALTARYFNLYDLAPVGYCTVSPKGLILEINLTGATLLGRPRRELVKSPLSHFIRPEDQDIFYHYLKAIFAGSEATVSELRMVKHDGTIFWVRLESSIVKNEDDSPISRLVFIDITANKLTDEALQKSNEFNASLLRTMPFPFTIVDQQGRVLYMGEQMEHLVGEKALASFCWELYKDDGKQCTGCPLEQPIQLGKTAVIECAGVLGGKTVEIYYTGMMYDGQAALMEIFIDITQRKLFEQKLRASDERFSATFEQAAVGIAHLGIDGSWLRVNKRLCEIVGYHQDELLEKTFQDITHPADLAKDLKNIKLLLGRRIDSYDIEKRYFKKDKTQVWINLTVSLMRKPSGEPDYFIAVVQDIDDRKKAQEALYESQLIFKHFMKNSPIYVYFKDQNLRVIRLSKNFEQLLGRPIKELLGKTMDEIYPSEFAEKLIADDKKVLREGKAFIIDEQFNGRFYTSIKFPINIDGEPRFLAGYTLDITDRKLAEAEGELLMAAFEQSGEAIVITDPDGIVRYVNNTFEVETGYKREEIRGQHTRLLKSGKQDETYYRQLWNSISSGHRFQGRLVNKRKDGSLYTEDMTISPVLNVSGEIVNYVAVKRNITEHIQLEEQFRQAQKMESVGRLAGGVAHDYNNMLSVILGFTQLAMDKMEPSHPIQEDLQEVYNAARTSADITRQLLAFARQQPVEPRVIDLNQTLEEMLKMLRRLVGEDINLIWMPSREICLIRIDPSQVDQIMANLCVNARDAISGVGSITIEVYNVNCDAAFCAEHRGSSPGEHVRLHVTDNGSGMDNEVLEKIFEPFYTSKEPGKGTGLGLATVYGIVKQNNGYISVESKPGEGTAFSIYFPQQPEESVAVQQHLKDNAPLGSGQTILIVEDERSILRLTQQFLKKLGYGVLTASTPDEAVSLMREQGDRIDMLITDVVMPDMNGFELSELLLTFKPDMKVLFMSGYSADIVKRSGVDREAVHYLQKPFSKDKLARIVKKMLR